MKHIGTRKIETDRLILRQATSDDAQAMYRNWASDPEVTKYLTWPTYTDPEDARSILKIWEKDYEKADFYLWAIGAFTASVVTCENNTFTFFYFE